MFRSRLKTSKEGAQAILVQGGERLVAAAGLASFVCPWERARELRSIVSLLPLPSERACRRSLEASIRVLRYVRLFADQSFHLCPCFFTLYFDGDSLQHGEEVIRPGRFDQGLLFGNFSRFAEPQKVLVKRHHPVRLSPRDSGIHVTELVICNQLPDVGGHQEYFRARKAPLAVLRGD